MKARGLTLLETLVALAVLATLAGICFPLGRSMLARSREAACLNQLRALGTALESYLQDHNQILPDIAMGRSSKADPTPVLETVLLPYVDTPDAFKCPQDNTEFKATGSSYFWNHLQGGLPVSRLAFFGIEGRPDKIPLISDKEAWHPGGTHFLYADQTSSSQIRFAVNR
jgi:prepilin-type N-terminal cleavage/methylation domain-containing protein